MQLTRAQLIGLIALFAAIVIGYFVVGRRGNATVTMIASALQPSSLAYNTADQSVYLFNRVTSQLSKVEFDGTITPLSESFPNVDTVLWAPDFQRALIRSINDVATKSADPLFRDGEDDGLILTWLYNLADRKLSFVNADYGSVTWAGNDQIVYYFAGDDPGDVSLAKPDGSERQTLMHIQGVLVSQIDAHLDEGLIVTGGADEEEDKLFFVDFATKQATSFAEQASVWVNGSNVLFVSRTDSTRLMRFDLTTRQTTEGRQFDSSISHVALGSSHAIVATEEGLSSFDLATNRKRAVNVRVNGLQNLFVFPGEGESFFFTATGNLYRLELP